MASGPITSWQIDGETMETVTYFILWGSKITENDDCSHEMKKSMLLGRKAMINLDSILKSRDITLPTKVHIAKAMAFPVVMYGSENWTIKKVDHKQLMHSTCGAGEDSWEFSDSKEIKLVNLKGNQSWIFVGMNGAVGMNEFAGAEAPVLWPPDAKSWLIGKDPNVGKDLGQVEKGMTEDEMIGWYHQLNGHEFKQSPGDREGQGSLAWYSPWSHKELDMTEQLNNNNNQYVLHLLSSSP